MLHSVYIGSVLLTHAMRCNYDPKSIGDLVYKQHKFSSFQSSRNPCFEGKDTLVRADGRSSGSQWDSVDIGTEHDVRATACHGDIQDSFTTHDSYNVIKTANNKQHAPPESLRLSHSDIILTIALCSCVSFSSHSAYFDLHID